MSVFMSARGVARRGIQYCLRSFRDTGPRDLLAGGHVGDGTYAGRAAGCGHTARTGVASRSQRSVARAAVGRLLLARAELSHLGQAGRAVG
jgi:hypothetical protein